MANSKECASSIKEKLISAFIEAESEPDDEIDVSFSDGFELKILERRSSIFIRKMLNSTAKKAAIIAAISLFAIFGLMSVKAIREPIVTFFRKAGESLFTSTSNEAGTDTESETDDSFDTEHTTEVYDDSLFLYPDAADSGEKKANNNIEDSVLNSSKNEDKDGDEDEEGHVHDYRLTDRILPTCKEEGYEEYLCLICKDKYRKTLEKTQHQWVDIGKKEICGENKEIYFRCWKCKETKALVKGIVNHVYEYQYQVRATCTQDGYSVLKCRDCGNVKQTVFENAIGHDNLIYHVEPTPTEEGYSYNVCRRCGEVSEKYAIIPPLSDICGGNHVWIEKTVEATCTDAGYTESICTVCGLEKDKEYTSDPICHSFKRIRTFTESCINIGLANYKCTICGYTEKREIEALGHISIAETVEPTCIESGYTVDICERCGTSLSEKRDITPPTGIHYYEEIAKIEPTCVSKGSITYKCKCCGESYTEEIDQLNEHTFSRKWSDGYVRKYAPTCTLDGYTLYICTMCGKTEKREIVPAVGHIFETYESVEATNEEPGYTVYKCKICGKTLREEWQ